MKKMTSTLLAALLLAMAPAFAEDNSAGNNGFINPALRYHSLRPIRPFPEQLRTFVEEKKSEGLADDISVYFRELDEGVWFGVGQGRRFAPASLLKVPVMMIFFKDAEKDPSVLQKRLVYKAQREFVQYVPSRADLVAGQEYTIEQLIEAMIVHSDNNAFLTLVEHINPETAENAYRDLGYATTFRETGDFLSLKTYAGTFRSLYNATYLDKKMSEKALELLSRAQFENGICAGLPKGVKAAHKFGEYLPMQKEGKKQLHDVGIVYYRDTPYILGVMTRGDDYDKLCLAISQISRFVYEELEAQNGPRDGFHYDFEEEGVNGNNG